MAGQDELVIRRGVLELLLYPFELIPLLIALVGYPSILKQIHDRIQGQNRELRVNIHPVVTSVKESSPDLIEVHDPGIGWVVLEPVAEDLRVEISLLSLICGLVIKIEVVIPEGRYDNRVWELIMRHLCQLLMSLHHEVELVGVPFGQVPPLVIVHVPDQVSCDQNHIHWVLAAQILQVSEHRLKHEGRGIAEIPTERSLVITDELGQVFHVLREGRGATTLAIVHVRLGCIVPWLCMNI